MSTEKHTSKTKPYLTLEDGEYQATSDGGGVTIDRESALGLATVRLRADYAAAPALLEALKQSIETIKAWHGEPGWNIYWNMSPEMLAIRAALALATGENPD